MFSRSQIIIEIATIFQVVGVSTVKAPVYFESLTLERTEPVSKFQDEVLPCRKQYFLCSRDHMKIEV